MLLQPVINTDEVAEIVHCGIAGSDEKIHARHKQQHVDNTRYHDPAPKLVLAYELVCLEVGFNGYDDLFKQ